MKLTDLKKKRVKAFTLVEVIIYLGLFGFIFTTIISFFLVTNEFNRNDKYQVEAGKSTIFVVEHLEESFKGSKSIDTANSTFDSDNGVLTLVKFDNTTIRYSVSNSRIVVLNNSSNFISPATLRVNKFRFERIIDNGVTKGVKFTFDATSTVNLRINKTLTYTYVIQ